LEGKGGGRREAIEAQMEEEEEEEEEEEGGRLARTQHGVYLLPRHRGLLVSTIWYVLERARM